MFDATLIQIKAREFWQLWMYLLDLTQPNQKINILKHLILIENNSTQISLKQCIQSTVNPTDLTIYFNRFLTSNYKHINFYTESNPDLCKILS